MEEYQRKAYTTLFNAITDALEAIERQNYGQARETLIQAQIQSEAYYIERSGQTKE